MKKNTTVLPMGADSAAWRVHRQAAQGGQGSLISPPGFPNPGMSRTQGRAGFACVLLAAALLCSPDASHAQGASKAKDGSDAAGAAPNQAAAAVTGAQAGKNLDVLYSQGLELESQGKVAEAVKLYEQAAKAGSAAAAKKLGDIYKTGKGGVARDTQTSLKYYAMAKQGQQSVAGKVTEPQAGGEKAKVEQDAADARVKEQAAAARSKAQQDATAKARAEQESKAKEQEAAAARAKAQQEAAAKAKADQVTAAKTPPTALAASDPQPAKGAEALYSQALALENQGNVVDAVKLYEQAAKAGSAAAAKKLGDIYKAGKGGVARDAQASLKYYAMAKQGQQSAAGKTTEPPTGGEKAKAEHEAADAKAAQEAAAARNKLQQEAAAKARAEQESAVKARAEQESAAKARAEQESAAAKAKEQAAAAARIKAQQEAAAKARAEQESAAAKAKEQEAAAARAKAQQEAAAKAKSDQEAAKAPSTALAASAPPAKGSDALYSQGLALEEQGNVVEAVKLYEQAVKAGSGPAAKKLGEIYGKGKGGVVRDGQASLRYFALAKQRGESVR
jgi:TPR repeat protein